MKQQKHQKLEKHSFYQLTGEFLSVMFFANASQHFTEFVPPQLQIFS